MHTIHIASIDLNLLVALDALLTERNVTRAAARIGVTQSAMSHSLKRLREMIGDPLLVRSQGEMVPTVRAETLAIPMRRAFREIESALAAPVPFNPKTATLRITIATSDYAEFVLLPRLVERLSREAPNVDVHVRQVETEMLSGLRTGGVDLAIFPIFQQIPEAGFFTRRLFDDDLVCVMRKKHPLAKTKLTLARYLAASHVLIAPRGTEGGIIDDALARIKRKRRVAIMVPQFLIAPHLVTNSDLLLTLATRVARALERPLDLVMKPVPLEIHEKQASFTMACVWHERTQNDPGHRWFRELLFDIAKTT